MTLTTQSDHARCRQHRRTRKQFPQEATTTQGWESKRKTGKGHRQGEHIEKCYGNKDRGEKAAAATELYNDYHAQSSSSGISFTTSGSFASLLSFLIWLFMALISLFLDSSCMCKLYRSERAWSNGLSERTRRENRAENSVGSSSKTAKSNDRAKESKTTTFAYSLCRP